MYHFIMKKYSTIYRNALYPILILLFVTKITGQDTINFSPYSCIYNHLFYLQEESYQPENAAKSFLNTIDSVERQTLAIQLKQIYDGKGLFVRLDVLPDNPMYFDSLKNEPSYSPFPELLPEIYLIKSDGDWYYSEESARRIPNIHSSLYPLGSDFLINLIPQKGEKKLFGIFIWQYLGLTLLFLFAGLLFFVFRFLLSIYPKTLKEKNRTTWNSIKALAALWISLKGFKLFLPVLLLPVKLMETLNLFLSILASIIILFALLKLANVLLSYLDGMAKKTKSKMDEQLLPLLKRSIQFIIITLWVLNLLSLLGVNITAMIAGISIGGLALALAAQDTLKNLFGSLTIFLDKPFQIGDWVQSDDVEGTVEEVGFRSTRIRSFANSLIYVPNSKISNSTINNYGLREYRRYKTTIGITYNTPPNKIEAFVLGLRKIVGEHPHTRKDALEIHFNNLGASALEILFYIFFDVETWTDELKAKQEILLAILQLAQDLGISFAYPSTSVYLENSQPPEKRV